MAEIVLINPRSEMSFWGLEMAMPLFGKKANLPPAALPLLAALTPTEHRVTLIDDQIETPAFDRVARADIVGLTGMTVHRKRMTYLLTELKKRGAFTVVGGPWVTVREDYFGDLADVIFVGEAEETWPRFLREWSQGRHAKRYEQTTRTDMTTVPTPRFDLLRMGEYVFGSVQFSRGCPFQCEFCDIIVTFGRRPRLKTSAQIIAELEALLSAGLRVVFIVDDNLIGNKQAIKERLRDVATWQQDRGYPMTFFTEASLDLAEDAELMALMTEARIVSVFVGIESPNEASLTETRKFQNVRRGDTLLGRIHAIQNAGLEVWCGMIVGFDNDDPSIFAAQSSFLEQAHIPHVMLGMLSAIPKTPLYDRLRREGRLDPDDNTVQGTNVIPKQIDRAALRAGFIRTMVDLYDPSTYFQRLEDLYLKRRVPHQPGAHRHWRRHPWQRFKSVVADLARGVGLFTRLMSRVPEAALRREYRFRLGRLLWTRPDPHLFFAYTLHCAAHYHYWTLARRMASGEAGVINSF